MSKKSSIKMSKKWSTNLHKNFLDYTFYVDGLKQARAKDMARMWESSVGKGLQNEAEA